jgi:hypothetical protein
VFLGDDDLAHSGFMFKVRLVDSRSGLDRLTFVPSLFRLIDNKEDCEDSLSGIYTG